MLTVWYFFVYCVLQVLPNNSNDILQIRHISKCPHLDIIFKTVLRSVSCWLYTRKYEEKAAKLHTWNWLSMCVNNYRQKNPPFHHVFDNIFLAISCLHTLHKFVQSRCIRVNSNIEMIEATNPMQWYGPDGYGGGSFTKRFVMNRLKVSRCLIHWPKLPFHSYLKR